MLLRARSHLIIKAKYNVKSGLHISVGVLTNISGNSSCGHQSKTSGRKSFISSSLSMNSDYFDLSQENSLFKLVQQINFAFCKDYKSKLIEIEGLFGSQWLQLALHIDNFMSPFTC